MVFERLADLRHYRGRRRGTLHVSRPLHVCVLRGRDRRVDAGAERIHLQGASVRPLRLQRQHQAERRQDLTGASWHFHVPVRSESSATVRKATFSSGVVPVGYNFRTTEQFTKAKKKNPHKTFCCVCRLCTEEKLIVNALLLGRCFVRRGGNKKLFSAVRTTDGRSQ